MQYQQYNVSESIFKYSISKKRRSSRLHSKASKQIFLWNYKCCESNNMSSLIRNEQTALKKLKCESQKVHQERNNFQSKVNKQKKEQNKDMKIYEDKMRRELEEYDNNFYKNIEGKQVIEYHRRWNKITQHFGIIQTKCETSNGTFE